MLIWWLILLLILGILVFFQWLSTKFDNTVNNIFNNIKYSIEEKAKEEERKSAKDFIIPIPNSARIGELSIEGEVISPANKTFGGYNYFEGVIKNNTDKTYKSVTISFMYDFPKGKSNVVSKHMGYLRTGEERYFRIKVLYDISTYKFLELTGIQ